MFSKTQTKLCPTAAGLTEHRKEKNSKVNDDDDFDKKEHWVHFSDLSLVNEPEEDKASHTFQLTLHFTLCSSHSVIPLSTNEALFPKQTWLIDCCSPHLQI